MLQDVINPQEQRLSMEEAALITSSPIASQLLDFPDDADLFPEALLRTSDVSSSSATACATVDPTSCSYDDTSFASAAFSPFPSSMDPTTFSSLLDCQPPDPEPDDLIAAAISNSYATQSLPVLPPQLSDQQDQFDQLVYSTAAYSAESMVPMPVGPPQPQGMLPPVYEEECLMPGGLTGYVGLDPGIGGMMYPGVINVPVCGGGEGQGFFPGGGVMVGQELGLQEMAEYQNGAVGVYGMEPMHHCYSSGELQVLGDRQQQQQQHLVGRCNSPTPLASEISTLDESTFKVGRLSVEERKEKIHRYMKKRNERNFSKKIKYACRKTLADSRPRVRGRFAKNEEFGETARPSSSTNEYDDDEEVVVKEEDIFDSSDILAHISGVNSFKYNYTLESWI